MQTNVLGIMVIILVVVGIIALLFWRFGRQDLEQPEPGRPKPTDLYYFLPDEVVFRVRHSPTAFPPNAEGLKADIVAAVQGFLGPDDNSPQRASANVTQPADSRWRDRLEMPEAARANVITLPFTNESGLAFSLVRIPVKGYDEKDKDQAVRSILRGAYAELKQNNLIPLANGYTIEDFSFNWLISNLHHGGATGGPGGQPSQAPAPSGGSLSFRRVGPTAGLTDTITMNMPKQTTYVAILDTAPTGEAIVDAYHNKWPNHSAIERLFGTNFTGGRLTVHYANPATLYDMEHFSPLLHTFLMPDHGTFIADIINSGAPDADLHLYQVLNRYGVGTFTSIAQGISDAIRDLAHLGRPLIINCSFQFCLPDGTYLTDLIDDLKETLDGLTYSMRQLFEAEIVKYSNIMVVASAGNDSPNRTINPNPPHRVPARFPAAFNNVIGVGALPKNVLPNTDGTYSGATYSNYADEPQGSGFMTFGGEPGAGQGVRGMYISNFPGLLPGNQTGWAWWAGTSFASAIITGLLAAETSGSSGFLPPVAPPPAGPYRTPDGETVILIEQ